MKESESELLCTDSTALVISQFVCIFPKKLAVHARTKNGMRFLFAASYFLGKRLMLLKVISRYSTEWERINFYPESTVLDGRQGVWNAQENSGGAQDPFDRCEARPVPRPGVRVVVQVDFETLHLVEVACGDIYVAIPFELFQGLGSLLTLQVGPPPCHDSWLWHPSRHLDRKCTII
jgi:hypothetical protein